MKEERLGKGWQRCPTTGHPYAELGEVTDGCCDVPTLKIIKSIDPDHYASIMERELAGRYKVAWESEEQRQEFYQEYRGES